VRIAHLANGGINLEEARGNDLSIPEVSLLTSLSASILISFARDWNFFIFNGRERFAIATKCVTR
jgi:hypothetical protein